MSDTDRIERHLQRYGTLSPIEFDGSMPVADSGKPIKRVAARIKELRDRGMEIRTTRVRGMGFYELVRPVEAVEPVEQAAVLFAPGFDELVPPRNAIMDEDAA
jgi:hypothetical protein